jgi:hypothetical protein
VLEVGDDPDRWAPPVRERGGEERRGARLAGPREEAHAAGHLGRAGEKEGKQRGQLGWAVREEKEKRRKKMGRAKREREREKKCIQMHLNLNLKFKFKWKINNKIMQYGMKCTRPIFSYISFYG